MKTIEEVKLPQYVTRNMFNCFEQQIITICQFYRGNFWRLFIDQKFFCTNSDKTNLRNLYSYSSNVKKTAEREYGICFEKKDIREEIRYEGDNELYLIEIESSIYHHTRDIEGNGTHTLIVYGENEDKYKINDNYYGEACQLIDKKTIDSGTIRRYKIYCNNEIVGIADDTLMSFFSSDLYGEYKKVISSLNEEYDYANDLIDLFTSLYQYCNRVALIIRNIDDFGKKDYLNACIEVIDKHVVALQNTVYFIIKATLKDKELFLNDAIELLNKRILDIRIVQAVMDEVKRLINDDNSIADRVIRQLKKYEEKTEEIDKIDENDSVYDVHDKLTILFLLNFFEDENPGISINYDEISGLNKYKDFMIKVYQKILDV